MLSYLADLTSERPELAKAPNEKLPLYLRKRYGCYRSRILGRDWILAIANAHEDATPADGLVAGMTALGRTTKISDDRIPTFCMAAPVVREAVERRTVRIVAEPNEANVHTEAWSYDPRVLTDRDIADPLSVYLTLREGPDERVQEQLETLLKRPATVVSGGEGSRHGPAGRRWRVSHSPAFDGDSRKIKKHRSDVFRLALTLPATPGPELPEEIRVNGVCHRPLASPRNRQSPLLGVACRISSSWSKISGSRLVQDLSNPGKTAMLKTFLKTSRAKKGFSALVMGLLWAWIAPCRADEQAAKPSPKPVANTAGTVGSPGEAQAQRDETFKKLVTNMRLSGHFTLDGEENAKLHKEEYVITGATKLGTADLWAITARIKFNDVDLAVPVPVQVKWAGDRPVIVLEKVSIPGLGTFSAGVLLDEGRYAGTWTHDEKGGHLFGTITPAGENLPKASPRP